MAGERGAGTESILCTNGTEYVQFEDEVASNLKTQSKDEPRVIPCAAADLCRVFTELGGDFYEGAGLGLKSWIYSFL